jgi:thioredoxin reductase
LGTQTEIIEMLGDISDGGNSTHKNAVFDMLTQKNIPIHFQTNAVEIRGDGVKCQSPDGEAFYEADAVIYAIGMRPLQEEALQFSSFAKDFHMIGECRKAANILFATSTAYAASRLIGRF